MARRSTARHARGGTRRGVAAATTGTAWALAGVLVTGALAASTTGAVSAFTARVDRGQAAATGTVLLELRDGDAASAPTCSSTAAGGSTDGANGATCATSTSFGDALVPGDRVVGTVRLRNAGTGAARTAGLSLAPCAQEVVPGSAHGSAGDLCSQVLLTITVTDATGTTTLLPSTAASAAAGTYALPVAAPGQDVVVTTTATLDGSAGNEYQGLRATLPTSWRLST